MRQWPLGSLSKAYAAYDNPFWRANGCSGEALSDTGPVFITFDVSPVGPNETADGPGVLLGFVDSREFDELPAAQRREQALAGFAALFGDEALTPIDYPRSLLGRRAVRPGRAHRGGATRVVEQRRAVATPAGRRRSSGRAPRPPTSGPGSSTARCAPGRRAATEVGTDGAHLTTN